MSIEQKKKNTDKKAKINPFDIGVSYDDFLKELAEADLRKYCENILSEEQIDWLENDIKIYKQHKKDK